MAKNLHMCEFLRIFALEMRKIAFILSFCAFVLCAHAETLLLNTGARVRGEIVFQNEEVIIIRNAEGARFQYPRSEVKEVLADDAEAAVQETGQAEDTEITTPKKASILLELAGGGVYMPGPAYGGAASVDLLVGSHHIKDRHLFVGGGIGYHGIYMGDKAVYNFLPIQAAVRMPLTESRHAPVFGASLGYGVALSKSYVGGIYAGLDFGYRYQANPKTAIGLVLFTHYQQAKITAEETVEGVSFSGTRGRNLLSFGAKFTLYF